jgi:hypothetical protein
MYTDNFGGASTSINGLANTGSGGGGAHGSVYPQYNKSATSGGSGGSGIVIVAYPTIENG